MSLYFSAVSAFKLIEMQSIRPFNLGVMSSPATLFPCPFVFSGGQIKNVVWNACFFAAKENNPVEMQHMVRAIQMELTKDKKVSFQEALGAYASLIY